MRPLLALCALLAALPLSAGQRVGPNVRVNAPQEGQYGRPGLAVAASEDGQRIVAAWDDLQGTCGPPFGRACPQQEPHGLTGVGVSTDGGRTWTDLGAPPPIPTALSGGHAWLDRAGRGEDETFYLVTRARLPDSALSLVGQKGILLHRGRFEDGRFVWKDVRYFGPDRAEDFWRGPSVAAAKDGSGRVYIALTNLRGICGKRGTSGGTIELLRSEDGGDTWSGPVLVSRDTNLETTDPKDPLCGTWSQFQFTPTISLGPSGEIYLAWQFGPELFIDFSTLRQHSPPTNTLAFSRSLDGGRTFSYRRVVATVNSLGENPPAGFSKDAMNDTPRLAVAQDGPHRGRLYLVYASSVEEVVCNNDVLSDKAYSAVSSQVWMQWSDDRGQTWQGPVPLGDPVPRTGIKRFFPTVAVHPGGAVDVVYFESRETQLTPDPGDVECGTLLGSGYLRRSPNRSLVDLWWVRSADGAPVFPPRVRVTSETSDWCAAQYDLAGFLFPNFGDYLGIFPLRGRTLLLWTDGRAGVPDASFATLGEGDP